jgi:hypothetical protein
MQRYVPFVRPIQDTWKTRVIFFLKWLAATM